MESPPFKIGQGKDRISALPDHLLSESSNAWTYAQRSAPAWSRCGGGTSPTSSRAWTSMRTTYLHDAACTTAHEIMEAYTATTCRLLSAECDCDCKSNRDIKTLILGFYLSAPHLSSIGHALQDVVSLRKTKHLRFVILPAHSNPSDPELTAFGRQFMSFSRAYPVAFRWLTRLTLENLAFGDTDVADLIRACNRLKRLMLGSCRLVVEHSTLKIDAPCSRLQKLYFDGFCCTQIELISVPNLREVTCFSWRSENHPPVRFELRKVYLGSHAMVGQAPFALSECLPRNARNLSKLHLNFSCQMIWIQPEHPKLLAAIFRNLTDVYLACVFPECDLSWTLFILEAATTLQNFKLSRNRHSCVKRYAGSAEKTNVVWEPSKDLKYLNLKLLAMQGFEEEDKVINYIRLVIERAVVLKRIELHGNNCDECNAISLDASGRFTVDEVRMHRIKEQLTPRCSSSVEIIII